MATYYHLRINLLSGTRLEGYTCKGLTRAVAKLDELTGRAWPYQVLHRALKAAGTWAESYIEPEAGSQAKGTYHRARAVVASLECAGAEPQEWLRNPDELPLHCWKCYEPLLRASNGWHSCMKHGAPHELESPEQLRERAQLQMKFGGMPPLTNKALQLLTLMVQKGEATLADMSRAGIEFFSLSRHGLAESVKGPGGRVQATAAGAAYVASLERWKASAGCADEDEGPAPYQLEFAAKEAAAEPAPAAAPEPAGDITDDWEACRALYQEMQRKYLIAMDKKWPGCNRQSHPHLFEPAPPADITDEWEVANAIFTDAIMQWKEAYHKWCNRPK